MPLLASISFFVSCLSYRRTLPCANNPDTCVFVHVRDSYGTGNLVGDTNDTASRARTSVTSLLGLLMAALAEVVGAGVDNDGALLCVLASETGE
jgi:hypothetical protein